MRDINHSIRRECEARAEETNAGERRNLEDEKSERKKSGENVEMPVGRMLKERENENEQTRDGRTSVNECL